MSNFGKKLILPGDIAIYQNRFYETNLRFLYKIVHFENFPRFLNTCTYITDKDWDTHSHSLTLGRKHTHTHTHTHIHSNSDSYTKTHRHKKNDILIRGVL